MTDDATLSDFASADSSSSGDDSSGDGHEAPESPDDRGSASAASADGEPASADETNGSVGDSGLSTYAWGEYACDRCDHMTDRVWRAEGNLVCVDCKEW